MGEAATGPALQRRWPHFSHVFDITGADYGPKRFTKRYGSKRLVWSNATRMSGSRSSERGR